MYLRKITFLFLISKRYFHSSFLRKMSLWIYTEEISLFLPRDLKTFSTNVQMVNTFSFAGHAFPLQIFDFSLIASKQSWTVYKWMNMQFYDRTLFTKQVDWIWRWVLLFKHLVLTIFMLKKKNIRNEFRQSELIL